MSYIKLPLQINSSVVPANNRKKRLGDSYATLNGFFHLYLYTDKVRNLQVTVQTVYAYKRIANVVGNNFL